jgi:glycosidase
MARGEWNGWGAPGARLERDDTGAFVGRVNLPEVSEGLTAYRFVVDGTWKNDPSARYRKVVGGVDNSAFRATDCRNPTLSALEVPPGGSIRTGTSYAARVQWTPGQVGRAMERSTLTARLVRDGVEVAQPRIVYDGASRVVSVETGPLAAGKYTLWIHASDRNGRAAKPLRLTFWAEAERFKWDDALLYMILTDRFRNGDRTNDPPRTAGVDGRAEWQGGDLQGITELVRSGYFEALGAQTLWLSPFNTGADRAYLAADGIHLTTGYHGYWPRKAREVDPRIGGDRALRELVAAAHSRGMRILADFVINHIHEEHEYFQTHPEWFRTGCTCGTPGCGWTEKALECLFQPYMPDVNWAHPGASEQFIDDAVWWIHTYDLDGLRVDAVKHVEDLATLNLSSRVREEFEASGTRVFLTGETAMGWNDCGSCNDPEYATISKYLGPGQLDGQFDFVLHHAAAYRVFAYDDKGLIHLDYWTRQSQEKYPAGAIMTPYIGSHDTARFVTRATYRGQSGFPRGVPDAQWQNVAGPPVDREPYTRHRFGLAWLLTIPGAPMIYAGDEYGDWGGSDPNNRELFRGAGVVERPTGAAPSRGALADAEKDTLAFAQALGKARERVPALRRGRYVSLNASEDSLCFARTGEGLAPAIVALSRTAGVVDCAVPPGLGLPEGAGLRERVGAGASQEARVDGGRLRVTVSARSVGVYTP